MSAETICDAPRPRRGDTTRHPGYHRLFAAKRLTLGLIMPLETYPGQPAPTMARHLEMAALADEIGFGALWMRDIPFFDPDYGDAGQIFEPLVYISALASITRAIALGTAGIVLPLREPNLLGKQVASLDQLSNGRMILGLSSGDRPAEYPLFDVDFATRGERFREIYDIYRTVTETDFPWFCSDDLGRSDGTIDLLPKPPFQHTPTLAIGRAQQSSEWIAVNMDGMIASLPPRSRIEERVGEWRRAVADAGEERGADLSRSAQFKPLGFAGFLDLVDDPHHPFQRLAAGFRSGSKSLAEFLETMRESGYQHAALNLKVSRRPYRELLEDLAQNVLPFFRSLDDHSAPRYE